jgi:hypothetical protein
VRLPPERPRFKIVNRRILWVRPFTENVENPQDLTEQPTSVPESHGKELHQEQQQEERTRETSGFQEKPEPPEERQQNGQLSNLETPLFVRDILEEVRQFRALLKERRRAFLDEQKRQKKAFRDRTGKQFNQYPRRRRMQF